MSMVTRTYSSRAGRLQGVAAKAAPRACIAARGRLGVPGSSCAARTSARAGFTLVETIVGLAILMILCAVVASVMVFGVNMMNEQRARANADMLCSMLSESVEDALEGATSVSNTTTDSVTFYSASDNSYRAAGTYTLGEDDGKLTIAKSTTSQSSGLVPASAYIDGLQATCTYTNKDTNTTEVTITITNSSGATMTTNTMTVRSAGN